MRLRNVKGSREAIQESIYVVHEEETRAGSWHDIWPTHRSSGCPDAPVPWGAGT